MDNVEDSASRTKKPTTNYRRLLLILIVGGALTAICFLLGWWWAATFFMLVTLTAVCLALPADLYPIYLTLVAGFAIAWVCGSLIDGLLPVRMGPNQGWRAVAPFVVGGSLGIGIPAVLWVLTLYASTRWILSVSDSLGVSGWDAFRFVATRVFDASQAYILVENGQVAQERPKGMLSKLGGPGVLVVRPGNAVVLERGGKITSVFGEGVYRLKRMENLKKPADVKGIVDLRSQAAREVAKDVLTKDGITLDITVAVMYQIEPQEITDKRPWENPGPLLKGEYPVYEETIRKAVLKTSAYGWKALFPGWPIGVLRDVVAAYTLDQIFPPEAAQTPDPDARTIRRIEQEVDRRIDASWAGVLYRGIDIQDIVLPKDVRDRMLKRWTTPVEGRLRIEEAEAERDAMIAISQGRATSLRNVEAERLTARGNTAAVILGLVRGLPARNRDKLVASFVSLLEELTNRVGQDEDVAMRYIEAMQAIVESESPKSFVITPPTPAPGILPEPPAPATLQAKLLSDRKPED